MSMKSPFVLRYTDDILISVAGPNVDVFALLQPSVETSEDADGPVSRFSIEEVNEHGEWQMIPPSPIFFEDIELLLTELFDQETSKDPSADPSTEDYWIPDGVEGIFTASIDQIQEAAHGGTRSATRQGVEEQISTTEAKDYLRATLRIQVTAGRCVRSNLSLFTERESIQLYSFKVASNNMATSSEVVVVGEPEDHISVYVGPAGTTDLVCGGPLNQWAQAEGSSERICTLDLGKGLHYGVVVHTRSERCKYKIGGAVRCKQGKSQG